MNSKIPLNIKHSTLKIKHSLQILLFFLALSTFGQNAPVTTVGTVSSAVPGSISVPITVTGFNNIGAITLSILYDPEVIVFLQCTPDPQLPGFLCGDQALAGGLHRLTLGWYGNGKTLPDGSTIISLEFNYVIGNTALEFYDNGPSCEYADGDGNVLNDTPFEDFYHNGYVCGLLGSPGMISGDNSVCQGSEGMVYSVSPMANATSFTWSIPGGAEIIAGQGTNLVLLDYGNNAISGYISVAASNACGNGPQSTLPVTVNSLPVANAGDDITIAWGTSTTLNAATGGSGSYSYHWEPEDLLLNPNVQNPQTVDLTASAEFILTVTNNTTLCQDTDTMWVFLNGGPLDAQPSATPAIVTPGAPCQLRANAGGGAGNYTYTWSSNPPGFSSFDPNPIVTPTESTLYIVTVEDGFSMDADTVQVIVSPLPTATVSGSDTLCGTGNSTLLPVDLTGTPEWKFIYSFGCTSVYVEGQTSSPYEIVAAEKGDYTVTFVEDIHWRGTTAGVGTVARFPYPPSPVVTLYELTMFSDAAYGNQWYKDGVAIPGATDVSYTAIENGSYYDIVTLNGCSSEPSNVIEILTIGIGELSEPEVVIWPNPAREVVFVRSVVAGRGSLVGGRGSLVFGREFVPRRTPEADDEGSVVAGGAQRSPKCSEGSPLLVELRDVYGRVVRAVRGMAEIEIDIRDLPSGTYIVKIEAAGRVLIRKIVKF